MDRSWCTERFQALQTAYETLSDAKMRKLYDEFLRWGARGEIDIWEVDFKQFRDMIKNSRTMDGSRSMEEEVLEREQNFVPSADDLKMLGLATGGFVFGCWALFRIFVSERLWLNHVPLLTQLEWVLETLPESFEVGDRSGMGAGGSYAGAMF